MAIQTPMVKRVSVTKVIVTGSTVMFLALFAAALIAFFQYRDNVAASKNATAMSETQDILLDLTDTLPAIVRYGNVQEEFKRMRSDIETFSTAMTALSTGGKVKGVDLVPTEDAEIEQALNKMRSKDWPALESEMKEISSQEETFIRLTHAFETLLADKPDDRLFTLAREVGDLAVRENEPAKLVELATQLDSLTLRLSRNAGTILMAAKVDPGLLPQLSQDTLTYRSVTTRLLRGDPSAGLQPLRGGQTRAKLAEFLEAVEPFDAGLDTMLADAPVLIATEEKVDKIHEKLDTMATDATDIARLYASYGFAVQEIISIAALLLVAVLALVYMAWTLVKDSRQQALLSAQENERNQQAILQLLDETSQVAEGDMTVRATVSEAITGAIADALNFTLDEMSSVVRGINKAADHMAEETEKTQQISEQLFAASQQQSQEILKTADTVLQVTQSIGEVAQTANESAQVAQESLDAAGKGGQAVRSQIESMSDIRAQIQETSKRIKRLGDSSLEIGEIVGLISNITEQTNVLALNAAIQAASAGEAGRGFAVVAEEVQRLAERSGEATKQIEAIVKTIQADTQDAVAAMDRSTTGVVQGTRLSEEAGQALADIERVSKNLSELIQGISQKTQVQAASVETVRDGIESMLKTTEDSAQGTEQTTVSIGRLSQVAAELRAAVSGFKV